MQLTGLAVLVGGGILVIRAVPVLEWLVWAQESVARLGTMGALMYPLLFALCNVLLLPGGVLAVGSGFFFGLWWGVLLTLSGNLLGAAIAFFVSRKLARRRLEQRFFQNPKWARLDAAIAREGWKIIFLSQVHPLFPTSLLNYVYGMTKVRFWPCMLWVTVGQVPGLFLYAYLGTVVDLGVKVWRGEKAVQFSEYGLWIGGLVVSVVVTTVLGKLALRLWQEAERQVPPAEGQELIVEPL